MNQPRRLRSCEREMFDKNAARAELAALKIAAATYMGTTENLRMVGSKECELDYFAARAALKAEREEKHNGTT